MNRTVRLEIANAAVGAVVLAEVVTAMAIRWAGPLATVRLRHAVEAAARAGTAPLRLEAFEGRDRLTLFMSAGDGVWAGRAVELLSAHGAAVTAHGSVVVELRRSPLRAAGDADV